eukprot:TRINITY_DN4934_c0_g1_i4.p1 TRINITY_DN4934_c0_g1~~TRINITY_DN4934_c0_g1_i4.p1  ORF type:complete len:271 (-),score=94.38 TRINITY_DN4934_c0_g1_i4:87-899(-)
MRIKLSEHSKDAAEDTADETEVKLCADKPADENDICRVCFSSNSDAANPLLSACKCTGSVKFIHFSCLKAWISLKLVLKESSAVDSYYWKSFECEICKTPYPYTFLQEDIRYSLVDVKKPSDKSFAVIKSLNQDKGTSRMIHVIVPGNAKRTFLLGRGHEADIRVTDISVSRIHASMKFTEDGVFVEDNASKFGTLVMIPKLVVGEGKEKAIQMGRTVVSFQVKANRNIPKAILGMNLPRLQKRGRKAQNISYRKKENQPEKISHRKRSN